MNSKILVIEDVPEMAELSSMYLTKSGMSVQTVSSTEEAFEKLAENKLITEEAKAAFINQFDWNKMTAQDMSIWSQILDVLNGE